MKIGFYKIKPNEIFDKTWKSFPSDHDIVYILENMQAEIQGQFTEKNSIVFSMGDTKKPTFFNANGKGEFMQKIPIFNDRC